MDERTSLPPSFEVLIQESEKPILVDFYADWCGPCKMVSPVIQRLAGEYKGRILTVKVDTEKKQALASRWNITGIPTIMLFHKGQVLMRLTTRRAAKATTPRLTIIASAIGSPTMPTSMMTRNIRSTQDLMDAVMKPTMRAATSPFKRMIPLIMELLPLMDNRIKEIAGQHDPDRHDAEVNGEELRL